MASKFSSLVLLPAIMAMICLSYADSRVVPDDFIKIDPNDPVAVDNGKFAIAEHNKQAGTNVQFVALAEAERDSSKDFQTDKLTIRATDGGAPHEYLAFVSWVGPGVSRTLESFVQIN